MRIITVVCFLLVFSGGLFAHGNHLIVNEKQDIDINLSPYMEFFFDTTATLSIEQVGSQSYAGSFHPDTIPFLKKFKGSRYNTWIRFSIENNSSKAAEWILNEAYLNSDTVISNKKNFNFSTNFKTRYNILLYKEIKQGVYEEQSVSAVTPFILDDSLANFYTSFSVMLQPHETGIYYIKLKEESKQIYIPVFNWYLHKAGPYFIRQSYIWWVSGINFGLILLLVIFALAMFLIIKEKVYLWLLIALSPHFIKTFINIGISSFYRDFHLLGAGHISDENFIFKFIGLIGWYLFATTYLDIKKQRPRLYKFLEWVIYPACILGLVFHLIPAISIAGSVLYSIANFILYVCLFSVEIRFSFRGMRSARILLSADIVVFVEVAIMAILSIDGIKGTSLESIVSEYTSAIRALIWTIAIIDRIVILRNQELERVKENEKLITNQNIVLEQKVKERTAELETEKQRSDSLLLNILPAETAEELKKYGKASAKNYDEVTVLFADIKGFTIIAEKLTPDELVRELDGYFQALDAIVEKHGLEKIKTIGDAYLCVGGIPANENIGPANVVGAALEMLQYAESVKAEKNEHNIPYFDIRIGIHTGPVVAGVVGVKKFAYDIWGDTVNTAARMEQHGEAGKINISETTYALIKNKFTCTYRGLIEAKNKGEIKMYFVEGAA